MLTLKQAYIIGQWQEMAYRLNYLAQLSGVEYKPLTVVFYMQSLTGGGTRAVIKLDGQAPFMTTQIALGEFATQTLAEECLMEARAFLEQMRS